MDSNLWRGFIVWIHPSRARMDKSTLNRIIILFFLLFLCALSQDFCKAKFHLVDLAGSERIKKTLAEGERMKEGLRFNKLMSFQCIINN